MVYANNGVIIDFIGGICQEGKYTWTSKEGTL